MAPPDFLPSFTAFLRGRKDRGVGWSEGWREAERVRDQDRKKEIQTGG